MKILSYNVRGLGRAEKRREVQRLVREKKPWVVCIQETKLEVVDDFLCRSLWGSSAVGFSFKPSVGAAGGILTLWDIGEVDICLSMSFENCLVVKGRFIKSNLDFSLVNVYAPCDSGGRQVLWERLGGLISNDIEVSWCILGDFNVIRTLEERRSRMVDDNKMIFLVLISLLMAIFLLIYHFVAGVILGT